MAGKRYEYTNAFDWSWLGPAFKGIDADLKDLEAAVANGGSGGEPTVTDLTTVYETAKAA